MRPVLSPAQMRAFEQEAFARGLSPLLLMEDAARELHRQIRLRIPENARTAAIFCGSGNNGGDGLALARLFQKDGLKVKVFLPVPPKTDEAWENLGCLTALGVPVLQELPAELSFDFCVDAIFGTGFHGTPEPPFDGWIRAIRGGRFGMVFSVDIPSGMDGARGTAARDADGAPLCVRADWTLMLGFPKAGLLTGPDRAFCGELADCPIQLPDNEPETDLFLLEKRDIPALLPTRDRGMHKGNAGRVLLYAGSIGMAGAAAMAAQAALRAGAGLVTVACEEELIPILQTLAPNAMCVPISQAVHRPPAHDVLAAGCGLGTEAQTGENLMALLQMETGPAVLDADALNLLAQKPFPLPEKTLLTPHVGEAARLLRTDTGAVLQDLPGSARRIAETYGANVLLKSSVSLATDGVRGYLNALTAPALAKGGSGDALCGMTAAFLAERAAQGLPLQIPKTAALSSLLLSLCGRRAEAVYGSRGALTGDILSFLPEAIGEDTMRKPTENA